MDKKHTDNGAVATPLLLKILLNTVYVAIWILLSGTVILYNKWVLSVFDFHYPITLTMWHMAFSAALATLCVRSGYVPSANLSRETYLQVRHCACLVTHQCIQQ